MQVKTLLALVAMSLLCADGFAAGKTEYKKIPYEEKIKPDKGLTFRLTFDKYAVVADYAKGDPVPKQGKEIELSLRGMLGFDGVNAFKKEKGETLKYDVTGNIDHRQGTIVFWVNAENYSPKDIKQGDPDNCHKGYVAVKFKNGDEWVEFFFYQYWETQTAYFYWQNSYPQSMGDWKICPIALDKMPSGQWFQIAATWDDKEIKTYLNGEFQGKIGLPPKAAKTLPMTPPPAESALAIRDCVLGPRDVDFGKSTLIDDISIYDYPMSDLQIKKQYAALANSAEYKELPAVAVTCHGVDRGDGKLGEVELELDFNSLPPKFSEELAKGSLKADYELINLDTRSKSTGKLQLKKDIERRILRVDGGGKYLFTLKVVSLDGASLAVKENMEMPDLSFAGNTIGKEDLVPSPWTPVKLESGNVVAVWNRKYSFQDGPFPSKIEVGGKNVLKKAPELLVKTPSGLEKIKYAVLETNVCDRRATIIGEGKAKEFTVNFRSTIEYDGLINTTLAFDGSPEIESMKICWTVAPEYAEYFLSPIYCKDMKAEYEFPGEDWRCVRQLWLASEQAGFCWAPANDANWVYSPGEKILKIERTNDGGYCEVDMITRKVKLPPATPYQILFMATPARPAPDDLYGFHLGPGKSLASTDGSGQTAFGEFAPDPVDYPELAKSKKPNSLAMYNFATGLTDSSLTGRFFAKYWDVPGNFVYAMPWNHRGVKSVSNTISCCPATTYSDFIMSGIKKLLDHEYGDRIWVIYYDLCGIKSCANKLHGCAFQDKFGRWISDSNILTLREHLSRTTSYCHQRGRATIYHAQNVFNPMTHSFADYWFAGEQFRAETSRNMFGYCDDIPDEIFRTEFNRRILGSALLFLPALNGKQCTDESTEAMFTRLLVHDIPSSSSFNSYAVAVKIFGVLDKYDLNRATARLYYEQGNAISADPEVKITYYVCQGNRYLLVLANKTKEPRKTVIDISRLRSGDFSAREEYRGTDLNAKDGKFEVTVPARNFMLVGF